MKRIIIKILNLKLIGYEYHNQITGHCFLDYDLGAAIPHGIDNITDYTKTALYAL